MTKYGRKTYIFSYLIIFNFLITKVLGEGIYFSLLNDQLVLIWIFLETIRLLLRKIKIKIKIV